MSVADEELLASLCRAAREDKPRDLVALETALVSAHAPTASVSMGAAPKAALVKIAALIVAGALVAGLLLWHPWSRPVASPAPRRPIVRATATTTATAEASPTSPTDVPTISVDDLPRAHAEHPAPSASAGDDLAAQVLALERARTALASGDAARVVTDIEAFHRTYPRSPLAEEADFVRVQALARAGRASDAQRLATEFLARYPRSPYTQQVTLLAKPAVTP
jgi:hypothetical protein